MSDSAVATGATEWLHTSRADVRVLYTITTKKGVKAFALDSRKEVLAYIASRGLARICGPVQARFLAGATADVLISAAATIVPTDVTSWPTEVSQVRADSYAGDFAVSALTPIPSVVLQLHPAINSQLKPRPFLGRHPAFLLGWDIQTSATTIAVDVAVIIPLEFSGVDWIQPVSW